MSRIRAIWYASTGVAVRNVRLEIGGGFDEGDGDPTLAELSRRIR